MNKKTLFITFSLFISLISFGQNKEDACTISGTISGDYKDLIYLSYNDTKDSIQIVDNAFSFTVPNLKNPTLAGLSLKGNPLSIVTPVWIEKGNIVVETDYRVITTDNGNNINAINITTVKGSHSQDLFNEYAAFYQANMAKENFHDLLLNKLKTFVAENRQEPVCTMILAQLTAENTLTPDELKKLNEAD